MSPFYHRADIVGVEPVFAPPRAGTTSTIREVAGARVTFRRIPGLGVARLQRLIDCHLMRNAALENDVPEMPYCPLVPRGVTAIAAAAETGIVVAIRGDDETTGREVLRRARALVADR